MPRRPAAIVALLTCMAGIGPIRSAGAQEPASHARADRARFRPGTSGDGLRLLDQPAQAGCQDPVSLKSPAPSEDFLVPASSMLQDPESIFR